MDSSHTRDRTDDDDFLEPPARPRFDGWRASILALAIAAVVLIAGVGLQRARDAEASQQPFCTGVALANPGPAASSPDDALAGYVTQAPGNGAPTDWVRTTEFGEWRDQVAFRSIAAGDDRTWALVARRSGTSWVIDGACA